MTERWPCNVCAELCEAGDRWNARCDRCDRQARELCYQRDDGHKHSVAYEVFKAGDKLADLLRRFDINPLYDCAEACGYIYRDVVYLYPNDPACARALSWLPWHVQQLLKAHEALWPLYDRLNRFF